MDMMYDEQQEEDNGPAPQRVVILWDLLKVRVKTAIAIRSTDELN